MTKKKPARTGVIPVEHRSHHHEPAAGRCLDILRQLSAYIDDELPKDICAELRRHVGACPHCEVFLASLRDAVTLCRHHQPPELSPQDRARLRLSILRAWKPEAYR